jgi:hypothetical protein
MSPESTDSKASMPSAGAMGSRALKVNDRATPMSDHWPQLIVVAGKFDARRHAAKPSSHALAAAYAPCPGEPRRDDVEEKPTHQSSSRLPVATCNRKAPAALGAQTRSRLSLLRAAMI